MGKGNCRHVSNCVPFRFLRGKGHGWPLGLTSLPGKEEEEELALALKGPFLAPTAKGRGCNSLSLLFFRQEGKKRGVSVRGHSSLFRPSYFLLRVRKMKVIEFSLARPPSL